MEIAGTSLQPIASLRPLTVELGSQLPGEQLQRHHHFYNQALALVEYLRADRYCLPPDPVHKATHPDPQDDPRICVQKSEYARLHKSLARELTRAYRQVDQFGDGWHSLGEHVQVEIAPPQVRNYRSDGSSRHANLERQLLVEVSPDGVPEAISRKGTTLYSGPQGFPLPPQPPTLSQSAIPERFSIVLGNRGVEVNCRALTSGLIDLNFQGHHLQVAFAGITPNRQTLEKIAYNYLEAVTEKVPAERLSKKLTVKPVPQGPPRIYGEAKPQTLPTVATRPPQTRRLPDSGPKRESAKPEPSPKVAADPKTDLKPKPPSPSIRIQLASGSKLRTTKARLRKARKLAAKVTKYDPHKPTPSIKEQVARRLAILSEAELEAFSEQIHINPSDQPGRPGWLDEEWLYQKSDEDPLLLLILQLLS